VQPATLGIAWDDEDIKQIRFIFTSVKLPNGTPLSIVISGDGKKLDH
jgi:hypothetical protein